MVIFINVLTIFIILSGSIFGFLSGVQKSFWRFIFFLISVILGLLIANLFGELFYNYNFSKYNINILGLRLRTISGFIKGLLAVYLPSVSKYLDSSIYLNKFTKGISVAVFRTAFFIFWMAMIVPLINAITILKKKKKKINKKERYLGSALGLIQSVFFLFLLFSPLRGVGKIISIVDEDFRASSDTLPLKFSGTSVFDSLFSMRYKGNRINFGNDLEIIAEHLKDESELELIIEDISELESTEIIGAAAVEIYLKSKNVVLTADEIKAIENIDFQEEIGYLKEAYVNFIQMDIDNLSSTKLLNLDSEVFVKVTNNLSKCSFINILAPYLLEDILPILDEYIFLPKEIILDEVIWTEEIRIVGALYYQYSNSGLKGISNANYRNDEENNAKIINLLFQSRLLTNNIEEIINLIFLKLPPDLCGYNIYPINEKEIVNALSFIGFLAENNFFRKDFVWVVFLSDDNINKMVNYLSSSKLLINNFDDILDFMKSKSNSLLENTIFPENIDWQSSEGKKELKCFFEIFRIFNSNSKYQDLVAKYTKSFILRNEVTTLVSLNTQIIIDYLLNRFWKEDVELVYEIESWETEAGRIEFFKILEVYQIFVETSLLYTRSLKEISDEDLLNLSLALSESETFSLNTNLILDFIVSEYKLPFPLRYEEADGYNADDYYQSLRAIKLIEIGGEENFFSLTVNEFEEIMTSKIIYNSFKGFLYDLSVEYIIDDEVIRPFFQVNLEVDDPSWPEEMKNLFRGLKIIIEKNEGSDLKLDLNIIKNISTSSPAGEDDLSVIFKSKILVDSLIYNIKALERNPNTKEGVLIIDIYEEDWLDKSSSRPGELRNFINGIQLLFIETGIDLNDPIIHYDRLLAISDGSDDTNGDGIINEEDENILGEIIRSKIIADTIIFLLFEQMSS
ncbi:MAG: hypothetical protein PHX62_03565 [Bacilli bacterium]|nr:hypothetical protein [Bacilli bacterium]